MGTLKICIRKEMRDFDSKMIKSVCYGMSSYLPVALLRRFKRRCYRGKQNFRIVSLTFATKGVQMQYVTRGCFWIRKPRWPSGYQMCFFNSLT